MTLAELGKRSATFLAMVVAGFFLGTYLDQHFTSDEADDPVTFSDSREVSTSASTAAACVGKKDGAWKNWQWPNVPAVSPQCPEDS
jgi:hypothetical protein